MIEALEMEQERMEELMDLIVKRVGALKEE